MHDDELSRLRDTLRNGEVAARLEAIDWLAESGDPRVVAILVEALQDGDAGVRLAAVDELGFLAAEHTYPSLVELLSDPDPAVRGRVAEALGALHVHEAVPGLIRVLSTDLDLNVRMLAARALGELRDARAVAPLVSALLDATWEDRQVPEALGLIGAGAIESLGHVLRLGSRTERTWAVYALTLIDDPAVVVPLLSALQDPDPGIRYWAPMGLKRSADARVRPALVRALGDPDDAVRAGVVAALRAHRRDRVVEADPQSETQLP